MILKINKLKIADKEIGEGEEEIETLILITIKMKSKKIIDKKEIKVIDTRRIVKHNQKIGIILKHKIITKKDNNNQKNYQP